MEEAAAGGPGLDDGAGDERTPTERLPRPRQPVTARGGIGRPGETEHPPLQVRGQVGLLETGLGHDAVVGDRPPPFRRVGGGADAARGRRIGVRFTGARARPGASAEAKLGKPASPPPGPPPGPPPRPLRRGRGPPGRPIPRRRPAPSPACRRAASPEPGCLPAQTRRAWFVWICPNSLWQKSIDRSRPESTEWRRLGGMAMGKKPAARQPSPMWVTTADLPTSAGHPFFERLNRVLEEAGFDAFVEGLCAVFYASRLGRPSLRPGRYFRLLFIGYFEGLSSERGIAWRVADSLSLRAFLDLDVTEAPPNHSTLSRTRRLIDVETHVAVFTWVLERLAGAGLVQGKTVGVDATTLEANAAMRSIERRDTGESYEAFVRQLAKASGIETPTRAELARFDRSRKDRKTSNKEWQSPQDTDAKIAKMKDGRTHLAHKAEHGIDLETGAILSVTVQEASEGDSATLPETLTMAAEQVEAVQPAGAEVEEVVADKGYHSDATLVALDEIGVRSYVSEPERGRRCWQDKKTGETPVGKRAAQKALYGNRRRIRGDRGRRLLRRRGELVERPFAHQYETGGLRRVWVRGHENVRKRVLIQAAGCNLGLLLRRLTGVGTPRSLQGRALSAICGLIGRLSALWGRLTASWDFQWTPAGLVGSIAHRQAA